MRIGLIVAHDRNRLIGKDGQLPWYIPEDLKYFKLTTFNHPCVMGRVTYESIGKPLPGRLNVVVSSTPIAHPDVITVDSLPKALQKASETGSRICFVIGGARLFKEAAPLATDIHITEIDAEYEGDTYIDDILGDAKWEMNHQYTTRSTTGVSVTFTHYKRE